MSLDDAPTLPGALFAKGDEVIALKSGNPCTVIRGEHHCLGDPTTVYVWVSFPGGLSGKVYPENLAHA